MGGQRDQMGILTQEGIQRQKDQTHTRNGINTAIAISNLKGVLHAKRCQHKMV